MTAGQVFNVQWSSDGLTKDYTALRMNVGGETSQGWLAEQFHSTDIANSQFTLGFLPDVTGVSHAAHPSVYQTGLTGEIKFDLPIPNGIYTVRLHFMEPSADANIATRKFDVLADGEMIFDDVNPFVETDGLRKPFTKEFTFSASGGSGLLLHWSIRRSCQASRSPKRIHWAPSIHASTSSFRLTPERPGKLWPLACQLIVLVGEASLGMFPPT